MSNVFKLAANGVNDQPLTPVQYVNSDNLVSGSAEELGQIFLTSDDERFSTGVWQCSPCKEQIASYPGDEYCLVLEGSVEITADGKTERYDVGDSFVIKKGTELTWNMLTPFKKYFALYC